MKLKKFAGDPWEFPFIARCPENITPGLPIIIQLHGAGERGDGSEDQLPLVEVHGFASVFTDEARLDCILIQPQCPAGSFWAAHVQEIGSLTRRVCEHFGADEDRVYLTGLSMGGFGTWYTAMEFPEMFAAIAPVCGGGMPWNAGVLTMPVWAFHGLLDPTVAPSNTIDMVEALKHHNDDVKVSLYEDVAHDVWNQAYTAELLEWLLSKRR